MKNVLPWSFLYIWSWIIILSLTRIAADEFATLTESHLDHHGILKQKPFQKSLNSHRERTIVRLSKCLAKIKNDIKYTLPFNPTRFLNAMRTHNKAKKAAHHLHQRSSTKKQEKAFQKNPRSFLNQFVRIIMCSRLQPFHRTHVIITLNHHTQTKIPRILNGLAMYANLRYCIWLWFITNYTWYHYTYSSKLFLSR